MDMANASGQKVIFIKVTGMLVQWRDKGNIHGQMARGTLACGKIINSVELENIAILATREYLKENMKMTKSMAKESLNGQMGENLKETFKMVFNMEKDYFIQAKDNAGGRFGKMDKG